MHHQMLCFSLFLADLTWPDFKLMINDEGFKQYLLLDLQSYFKKFEERTKYCL